MMRFKLLILVLLLTLKSFATHNRAGYISYTYDATTGKYRFTIYTYTNPSSVAADRCSETLLFMDPVSGAVVDSLNCTRINNTPGVDLQPTYANCATPSNSTLGEGLMLLYPYALPSPSTGMYGGVKVNMYQADREISLNISKYVVGMIDPNLDDAIQNLGNNSAGIAFALLDTLKLSNQHGFGYNNTPLVTNPPIDNACYHQTFCYNPGMLDNEGDSMSYSIVNFITGTGSGHFTGVASSFIPKGISVNPVTGELCWTSAFNNFADQNIGEYEIDMLIKEYRENTIDKTRHEIGSMLFAIQIYVNDCPPNAAVSITPSPPKSCIEAGSLYTSPTITTTKPASTMSLSASGIPISGTSIGPNASWSSNTGIGTASGNLSWVPSCEAVHLNPYYVTVQGSDGGTPANTNYSTLSIQVVSPPVTNLTAVPFGDSIKLSWQPPLACGTNQYNKINSYLIYRINSCANFTPNPCQTGVPSSSGFQYIGTTTSVSTTPIVFYDDNSGQGLPAGNSYSYLVVAKFDDGSLSIPPASSPSTCVTLHFGVPIITNVNVDTTDSNSGSIFVRWQKPVVGGLNLDTLIYPGPYRFELHRLDAAGTYTTIVYTSPSKQFFRQLNTLADTTYIDTLIDTQNKGYYYKVYFYSGGTHNTGNSAPASSVFAAGVGHDKKVVLSWTSHTPWQDTLYNIYQQNYNNSGYTLVGTTHNTSDTIYNLTNNYPCCFKIQSVGSYLNPYIISPLYNFSQKICVSPVDDVPPCQPQLTITGDCDAALNKLVWRNPDHQCGINDVLKYYIYYTPRMDSTLTKIDSVLNVNDTTYTTNVNTQSIAGCYVVVAVDSAGNQSPLNNESCTDNCPEYELPNIFTPNGDNANDLYVPVKNRYIRNVDFVLYNRWGEVIYEATNPSLGWDGKSKQMKQPVPDGVYFYTCTVYEIHFYGLKERKLKGFVQIIK